jgi:hypothetical protein
MIRLWLAAALACVPMAVALAQVDREVKVPTGKEVRVAVYANIRPDCTPGPLPAIRLMVPPTHGKVTVKRGTLKATNIKQCLAAEVPALVAFYRSAEGYNGADEFLVEIVAASGRKQEHFRVSVSDASGGQGI